MMRTTLLAVFFVACSQLVRGAEPAANDKEKRQILDNVKAYVAAFNARDPKALAAQWSQQGIYVSPVSGEALQGREAIEHEFQAIFAGKKDVRLVVDVDAIRFISDDVAIEDGRATVLQPGKPPVQTNYSAIDVKRDGKWQIDTIRETIATPAAPSGRDRLSDLEWLVGQWIDKSGDATITTDCAWTANQAFLTRSFTVKVKDQTNMQGTQIIGWDPVAGRIRSWVFDSDGGFSEGFWRREKDRWVIKTRSVLPGGNQGAAVNVLTRVDDDTCTWKSIGREVDGVLLPNVEEVTLHRQPAKKKTP